MLIWINGEFVEHENADVSIFDAGFQHGIGLFETMGAANGRVFRAEQHMQRLAKSAKELLLTERLRTDALVEAVNLAVKKNELDLARVRLTITGGNLSQQPREGQKQVDPGVIIVAQPPTQYPESFFTEGVRVMVADSLINSYDSMAGHKTLNYWPRIRALQIAAGRQAGEALWFSVTDHLVSGCVSNVFLVKDGRLSTPIARGEEPSGTLRAPVLPGITRDVIVECAEAELIEVRKENIAPDAMQDADEMFLTNSSWGVLPVVGVGPQSIRDGNVGPITQSMRNAWLERVEVETATDGDS